MPKNTGAASLSSNDPTTRVIAVRLPADLLAAVDAECSAKDITASEFLRGLVSTWVYGSTSLAGPDEGYAQARALAGRIAHAAVQNALEQIPSDLNGARAMLEGRRVTRRKR
mgnify:FL=1